MLLRKIVIGGAIFAMLGVASFYAAPAKKMSAVRVGQLEAEYRKATPPRKDQIIQELTAAGFGHVAQQIIKRYEPTKQQEGQKPTQAAAVAQPAPGTQLSQQEKNLLEQRKKDLLHYNQQLQDLEREIGFIVDSSKTVSEVDAMSNKIDALQALQQTLNVDASDIKKLRENLAQKKQLFLKKQEQERAEIDAKVSKAIENVKKAESLDQINQALSDLKGEQLRSVFSKLESEDQEMYQKQLNQEIALLEQKKQDLLQKQTEQQKAEQERKAQEEAAKEKAAREAALKAEQEKIKQQELELENKRASLRQSAQEAIKKAGGANKMSLVLDAMGEILYNLDTLEGTEILQKKEKEGLEQGLKKSLDVLIEKVNKHIATNMNAIKNAKTESQMSPLLDEIQMMKNNFPKPRVGEHKIEQLLKKLQELENEFNQKIQLIRKGDADLAKAQNPIFSQGQTKVTIRIPDLVEDKDKSYDDVTITRDAKGNIKEIQYQGRNIDLVGGRNIGQDPEKFIGAQVHSDEIIKKNQYLKAGTVSTKLPNAAIINSVNILLAAIEQSSKVQDTNAEQHRYFYSYLKPAVEARLKKLE